MLGGDNFNMLLASAVVAVAEVGRVLADVVHSVQENSAVIVPSEEIQAHLDHVMSLVITENLQNKYIYT